MAEISFPLPDLGEGLIEATVLEWLVSPGDQVERNQALVEVETTKSAVELPSPQAGKVVRIYGGPGDRINVGEPLIVFECRTTPPASWARSRRKRHRSAGSA